MGNLIKSIYAGIMIGFGGTVYLSMENRIVGAILFSFGLLTIITQQFNLYTGKVGYKNKIKDLMITIIGNALGTFLIAFMIQLSKPELIEVSNNIWQKKMLYSGNQAVILSIFCGAMMYLAVDNFKKSHNLIFIILPVVIFILSGFEHSIANLFYMFLSNNYNKNSFIFILICLLCNGVGAKIMNYYNVAMESLIMRNKYDGKR